MVGAGAGAGAGEEIFDKLDPEPEPDRTKIDRLHNTDSIHIRGGGSSMLCIY
jgi:hypothetical protein